MDRSSPNSSALRLTEETRYVLNRSSQAPFTSTFRSTTASLCASSCAAKTSVIGPCRASARSRSSASGCSRSSFRYRRRNSCQRAGSWPNHFRNALLGDLLHPLVDRDVRLLDAARPQPVDQYARAVARRRRRIGALELDVAGSHFFAHERPLPKRAAKTFAGCFSQGTAAPRTVRQFAIRFDSGHT